MARDSRPHPESHALVRYNLRAATQLDASGKVRSGAVFPDSSIIVKELSNGTTVSVYAVMMKVRGSSSAGFDGWIWAELGRLGSSDTRPLAAAGRVLRVIRPGSTIRG